VSPRDAFPASDDQIKIDGDFEDGVQSLLTSEVEPGADDVVEPVLDE
jgi:hypothetical protein